MGSCLWPLTFDAWRTGGTAPPPYSDLLGDHCRTEPRALPCVPRLIKHGRTVKKSAATALPGVTIEHCIVELAVCRLLGSKGRAAC